MRRLRIDDNLEPAQIDGWMAISSVRREGTSREFSDQQLKAIDAWAIGERALSEALQCENLVVLTGLGTSLCIKGEKDESLFPTMRRLWSEVEKTVGNEFGAIRKYVNHVSEGNIEDLLSRCLMAAELFPVSPKSAAGEVTSGANEPSVEKPNFASFIQKAESVIRFACRKELSADATVVHEEFLRRITRRPPRRPRPCLFTTNYDLCFETAAARIGLTVIDGFSFSGTPRFNTDIFDYDITTAASYSKEPDFVPRLLRLFKLHGSVDWCLNGGAVEKNPSTDRPTLIYPQLGKYAASYSPPFLEMMARFQGMLRLRNVGLLVICSGFNDLHIAEPILAAVKSNASIRVVVSAPDLCTKDAQNLNGNETAVGAVSANSTLRQLDRLLENGDGRLTFVNAFFPDLVKLMPMLPVQTDAEQHESRLRALEAWVASQKTEKDGR
jgi:hypothetical protein